MNHTKTDASINEEEPLGYQHYLYDVKIEYNPGGNRSGAYNSHNFKLKCLPYMVRRGACHLFRNHSITSSDNSTCDQESEHQEDDPSQDTKYIDVKKTTCAFLSNSDYVPNHLLGDRRVVLELISAKLSQQIHQVPIHNNLDYSNDHFHADLSNSESSITSPGRASNHTLNTSSPKSSFSSSRRFVNYTLLIKEAPGLDKSPAVIERRFSDFLNLYQGLKARTDYLDVMNKSFTFPKKVYMGNFSTSNITDRSVEFTRLLNLCMANTAFLWSVPFISFLLDKELIEAHRCSLCGDPDDVLASIETVYRIQKKIYFNRIRCQNSNSGSSSASSSVFHEAGSIHCNTPPLSNGTSTSIMISNSPENIASGLSYFNRNSNDQLDKMTRSETTNQSINIKSSLPALNQRILVTFCIMFLAYHRNENFQELKLIVQEFTQLLSSHEYVESILHSKHYFTLRACLLFLMNMSQGDLIEESNRLWLKRKLEDIDDSHANIELESPKSNIEGETISPSPKSGKGPAQREKDREFGICLVTKRDLNSLLRDRNFCSFQDKQIS